MDPVTESGGLDARKVSINTPDENSNGGVKYDQKHKKYSLAVRPESGDTPNGATEPLQIRTLDYNVDKMRKTSCIAFSNPVSKQSENLVKAIEFAAFDINEKERKKQHKSQKKRRQSCSARMQTPTRLGVPGTSDTIPEDDKVRHVSIGTCNCAELETLLEEYKNSESILSNVDRGSQRRLAIAEKSEIERQFIKSSVKYLMQSEYDDNV